nr:response regulator transcription factor [Telmatospirillum sp. J64-1]
MATDVVLVDDDDLFRESLARNLADEGFNVVDFGDGPSALDYLLGGGQASLVILDWKMPAMNGIEVLRRMRDAKRDVPVIFLTALTDQIYEEAALATGAVDFVEKSRSFSIVKRRIELIMSGLKTGGAGEDGKAGGDDNCLELGSLTLRLDTHRAYWKGQELELTLTEFKIVHHLAARQGADVSYREIYDVVHGSGFIAGSGEEGYRANVRTFIKRIRQKFRNVDDGFEQIGNYAGFGYRWNA